MYIYPLEVVLVLRVVFVPVLALVWGVSLVRGAECYVGVNVNAFKISTPQNKRSSLSNWRVFASGTTCF